MIRITSVSFRNFLSVGNVPVTIRLDSHKKTIISGKNGQGKCLDPLTQIKIEFANPETEKAFADFLTSKGQK